MNKSEESSWDNKNKAHNFYADIKKIGVVGSTGKVGRIVCDELKDKYNIIKGSSNKDRVKDGYVYIDFNNEKSVDQFCRKCDIVVNCAGPTYIIQDKIAKFAHKNKAIYIDAFGGNVLEDKLKRLNEEGVYIISAGCLPGLSGVLVKELSKEDADNDTTISIYTGGLESGGKNACADIILSSVLGYGMPNQIIKNSNIYKSNNQYNNFVDIDGFKESVYIQEFLTAEMIKEVELYGIKNLISYQAVPNKKISEIISNGCINYINNKNIWDVVECADNEINKMISGEKHWFSMLAKRERKKFYTVTEKKILVKAENSTIITAYMMAAIVQKAAEDIINPGVYWGFEILKLDEVIEYFKGKNGIIQLTVENNMRENIDLEEGMI